MRLHLPLSIIAALGCVMVGGCTVDVHVFLPGVDAGLAGDETQGDSDGGTSEAEGDGDGDSGSDGGNDSGNDSGNESGANGSLDLGGEAQFGTEACKVVDNDGPLPCDRPITSNVIDPVVAWSWTGPDGEDSVIVTPLVANFDDDNHDGAVDLCDTPDVIVIAVDLPATPGSPLPPGHIYVIDSRTGATKFVIGHPDHRIDASATPAVADLDGDGFPELVALERSSVVLEPGEFSERRAIAFHHDGSLAWVGDATVLSKGGGAIAIADLDADGSPEIIAPEHVLSADGELLWAPPDPPSENSMPIAADLDLDGVLEVLFGSSVYSHDGELLFEPDLPVGKNEGIAAIGNFDEDPLPEIYVQSSNHRILENDGQKKAQCGTGGGRPVAIEDIDQDGHLEILTSHGPWIDVLRFLDDGCETVWSIKLGDAMATSSATAFDLLGNGGTEIIYTDQKTVRIFDAAGQLLTTIPRIARANEANPIVVDADNDGAAEIIVVGSEPLGGDALNAERASVIMIENVDDAFAPTRRIWNQHAYFGSNIREDASVPTEQPPHWLDNNSFRTNETASYDGPSCQPTPVG